ncbi:hypothetical protein [Thermoanaerobacterium sp. RBIITD]|uniref:hypothetical protein n=1 Tax=Thermoanaerobacterium sp. RBIITD TaxID=1550240 RepID=UPI000BB9280D|nr:hypothetical protein [Thermoanaerobacterium sp. RBIITD]SNX55108.1 hypothetical protein SAMN05660242_2901 [Thermoanaerobacterium sp. RBIITD]
MANRDQLRAVGEMCPDFTFDDSLYKNGSTMSINEAGGRSCEICMHWDTKNQKCKIDVFDDVLTSLDQT